MYMYCADVNVCMAYTPANIGVVYARHAHIQPVCITVLVSLQDVVSEVNISANIDTPEGCLDALVQATACPEVSVL